MKFDSYHFYKAKHWRLRGNRWTVELSTSGNWLEFGLGANLSFELSRDIVSDDVQQRGRWAGIFITLLWVKFSASTMFACKPYKAE